MSKQSTPSIRSRTSTQKSKADEGGDRASLQSIGAASTKSNATKDSQMRKSSSGIKVKQDSSMKSLNSIHASSLDRQERASVRSVAAASTKSNAIRSQGGDVYRPDAMKSIMSMQKNSADDLLERASMRSNGSMKSNSGAAKGNEMKSLLEMQKSSASIQSAARHRGAGDAAADMQSAYAGGDARGPAGDEKSAATVKKVATVDQPPNLEVPEIEHLKPRVVFGINGKVLSGLRMHPDRVHLVYSLGCKLAILDVSTHRSEYLSGHTHEISCIDISADGSMVVSGQINHMGFKAFVILWNYAERREIARHDLHKVRVESVCFSAKNSYIISIGGIDDGSVIVYDIESRAPICQSPASRSISGPALYVCPMHCQSEYFLVAGDRHLRMWSIERDKKKLHVHDVETGKQQRYYTTIRVDQKDQIMYLGTMTGDIVKVLLNCCELVNVTKIGYVSTMMGAYGVHNPRKPFGKDCERFSNGVRTINLVAEGILLVGAGDGTISLLEERTDISDKDLRHYPQPTWPKFREVMRAKVNGAVTSITKKSALEYYVGTDHNEVYKVQLDNFEISLIKTCHQESVYSICFPKGVDKVFASAGYESIRVWSVRRQQELLRIMVYNFHCACIEFNSSGTAILSCWNDGIVRAFTPVTGRLIFAIPNAHNKGCSALTISKDGRTLVTGGVEGQVRLWKLEPVRQSLLAVLKAHSAPISTLDFSPDNKDLISACTDSSCVIWDMTRMARKIVLSTNTQFMAAYYFPTGVHVLTCGTDGRIGYWASHTGCLIREIEGSHKSPINSISLNRTGDYFITVGADQLVRIWNYNLGITVAQGNEHAAPIIACSYSPSCKFFVTGSSDGSIIIWDVPEKFWGSPNPPTYETPPATPQRSDIQLVTRQPSLPKVRSKEENIADIMTKAKKDQICCVECPPIDLKKKAYVDSTCQYVADVRTC